MNTRKKLLTWEEFASWRQRSDATKIVFTNGCFDILHSGHVDYLEQAGDMGDFLVVGLNSDESVKRLKGGDRPVNPAPDRARVLAGLACVDFVLVFEQDTPYELIKMVRPHLLIKGGDWPVNTIVGRDIVESLGGQVLNIKLSPGYSTTGIISRIKDG